jgi:hypothetical protein
MKDIIQAVLDEFRGLKRVFSVNPDTLKISVHPEFKAFLDKNRRGVMSTFIENLNEWSSQIVNSNIYREGNPEALWTALFKRNGFRSLIHILPNRDGKFPEFAHSPDFNLIRIQPLSESTEVAYETKRLISSAAMNVRTMGLKAFDESNAFVKLVSTANEQTKFIIEAALHKAIFDISDCVADMGIGYSSPFPRGGFFKNLGEAADAKNEWLNEYISPVNSSFFIWQVGGGMPWREATSARELRDILKNRVDAAKVMKPYVMLMLYSKELSQKFVERIDAGLPWTNDLRKSLGLGKREFQNLLKEYETKTNYVPKENLIVASIFEIISKSQECLMQSNQRQDWLFSYLKGNPTSENFQKHVKIVEEYHPKIGEMKKIPTQTLENGRPVAGWHHDLDDSMYALRNWVFAPAAEILQIRLGKQPLMSGETIFQIDLVETLKNIFLENRTASRNVEMLWKVHREIPGLEALRVTYEKQLPPWPAISPSMDVIINDEDVRFVPLGHPDAKWRVQCLTSAQDLVIEGKSLHHCVGGYHNSCLSGKSHIISFRLRDEMDEWRSVGTLEVQTDPLTTTNEAYRASLKAIQFRGFQNSPFPRSSDNPMHREIRRIAETWMSGLVSGKRPIIDIDTRDAALNKIRKSLESHVVMTKLRKQDMLDKAFPVFWKVLPGSHGKTLKEWIEDVVEPIVREKMGEKLLSPERRKTNKQNLTLPAL